ncbi:hypothetical protein ALC152_04090 [Arcobacter sp. 15-2]|uniref:hypothetical protein n=1 Tax=Arcobacter sp. 15-2 TaxID=3374109 RepID=UPI00399C7699
MFYITIKLLHIFSVFIYAGFLFTDNLILMRMQKTLTKEKYIEIREHFRLFTKVLVPKALIIAVLSGMVLFYYNFGSIGENGLENFQILLGIKATLGLWLGIRGVSQVFFGIQPFIFKSHRLPFILTIFIILLSQIMFSV